MSPVDRDRTRHPGPQRARRHATALAGIAVALVALTACSGDGPPTDVTRPEEPLVTLPEGSEPAPSPTDAPAPEPTAAPEPTPTVALEEPTTTEPVEEGDGTTTEEAIVVILLILLVIGVIAGLVAWLSNRSSARRQVDDTLHRQLAAISSRTRWVIDQGVPSVMSTIDPMVLESSWASVDTTLLELQQELSLVAAGLAGSSALADLGTAVAGMRGALDNDYRMRAQHADQPDLVSAADRAALAQRDRLQQAILAFEATTA